ncbi:MAG: TAXI family TRAP transporter solute-binding subunit [Deltaproteobacteria bacterium]|nr:TAXI family TRAP transporter solute-binding subunit [Deltaproteobacteria bacterium]
MKQRWIEAIGIGLSAITLVVGLVLGAVPRSATLATHAVGTGFNAMGVGIGALVSRHTPMTVRVQPFAGPPAWLPSMDKGETDMGILSSADATSSYKGVTIYKRPFKNTRILVVGGTIGLTYFVPKDSRVETVADLKGKRIPTDYPAIPIVRLSSTAALATAGLSYNDIVKVPVSDMTASNQAYLEGRVDAGWLTVGAPAAEEINARTGGIKFISVNSSPEGAKRMADSYPGSYPSVLKAGSATGIVKDTAVLTNDIYLVAGKDLSDEAAYDVVKVLWEFNQELGVAHPLLKEWRRERMVSPRAFIPYHPGAIRFFSEKRLWTKETETLQAKLLSQ